MSEIDFMSVLHKSTKRDYLARVNDKEYPKARAAELAKKFDYDYWDGDRRICYSSDTISLGDGRILLKQCKRLINYLVMRRF